MKRSTCSITTLLYPRLQVGFSHVCSLKYISLHIVRKVNVAMKPDSFPLPRVEDRIDQVGAGKCVSKFDLFKGVLTGAINSKSSGNICFHNTIWFALLYSHELWLAYHASYISEAREHGRHGT